MASEGPRPVGPARYGLQRVQVGLYLHRGGRYILRSYNWEGPQGGKYSRWNIGDWVGGWSVDADTYGTLREAAAALDGGLDMTALGVVAAAWRAGDLPECPICHRSKLKLPVGTDHE